MVDGIFIGFLVGMFFGAALGRVCGLPSRVTAELPELPDMAKGYAEWKIKNCYFPPKQ